MLHNHKEETTGNAKQKLHKEIPKTFKGFAVVLCLNDKGDNRTNTLSKEWFAIIVGWGGDYAR